MGKLLRKLNGAQDQLIELKLGANRFGRSEDNDFRIDHPTVSAHHCEIFLIDDGVLLRDCDSTNGTYVDGHRVKEARLQAGQTVRLGEAELHVESVETTVAIPQFDVPIPAPPIVLSDGSLICPRHPEALVTHQCTHCREVMCDACVHRLRRKGGKVLKLCPLCSHPCEVLGGEKKKKKRFFGLFERTVKLPFLD